MRDGEAPVLGIAPPSRHREAYSRNARAVGGYWVRARSSRRGLSYAKTSKLKRRAGLPCVRSPANVSPLGALWGDLRGGIDTWTQSRSLVPPRTPTEGLIRVRKGSLDIRQDPPQAPPAGSESYDPRAQQ